VLLQPWCCRQTSLCGTDPVHYSELVMQLIQIYLSSELVIYFIQIYTWHFLPLLHFHSCLCHRLCPSDTWETTLWNRTCHVVFIMTKISEMALSLTVCVWCSNIPNRLSPHTPGVICNIMDLPTHWIIQGQINIISQHTWPP